MTDKNKETHEFRAEASQLLDLMIHSVYSNKEIFLRELISNSSDALDRLRFEALSTPELVADEADLRIDVSVDAESRTLTIRDGGIGMSHDDLVENLGTIARSGTREFLEKGGAEGESVATLIGQFGVGFYSAFMVASQLTVTSRRAGLDEAWSWQSAGDGSYTIEPAERETSGTTIVLQLKEADPEDGLPDLADVAVLTRIIRSHSDFITWPIRVGDEAEPINSMKAIWRRPKMEVSEEEYAEFFGHLAHSGGQPRETISIHAEGSLEYHALLFIPPHPPFDLFMPTATPGLALYVRSVLIVEQCPDLLPNWLRFVKGVVESPDLPLNVSRELLQANRSMGLIRKRLTRKVLDALDRLRREEREIYLGIWSDFGRLLKEGVDADREQRDKLVPLLLFQTSAGEELVGLDEYVERMPEDQSEIFYLLGESRAAIEASPHLEAFQKRGYEVLYFVDPVDEIIAQVIGTHADKRLRSAAKGDVELGTEEEREKDKKELEEKQEKSKGLLEVLQKALDETVKEVRFSNRMTDSPACLVSEEWEVSPQLEKLLIQAGQTPPPTKRILELNPDHSVWKSLERRFEKDSDDPGIGERAELLFGQALLAEGSDLPDPARFNRLVADLMARS